MSKILEIIYKAYKRGFVYTFLFITSRLKLALLSFFKVKIVHTPYGVKCFSDFNDETFRLYFLGVYGFFYSNFLKSYASNFIFIDVGANKGLYSIIAAKNENCEKVISFEPIPETYDFLTKNCSLNNIINKCELHNLAISNACEVKEISFNKFHSGMASLALSNENEQSNFVSIHTVDKSIFANFSIEHNKKYILKVDVEGFELTVLKEIFECEFSHAIINIFYEVNKRWVNPSTIEKLLSKNGFKNFEKHGDSETHYDVMASK